MTFRTFHFGLTALLMLAVQILGHASQNKDPRSLIEGFSVTAIDDSLLNRPTRPKVGLVLSGGGAKGAAHIGVLKMIEDLGIPVDYVTGTSMGSIMGGLYALGYTPEEMQAIISNIDWSVYMSDRVPYKYLSYQEKQRRSQYLIDIPVKVSSHKESIEFMQTLPGGFVGGNSLENLFNALCMGYQGNIDFNSLPRPFACVVTDLVSGHEIVLRKGFLPQAIRSSMSIPGVFAPVKMGDMILVDGGLKNNMPVDICKQMGADIVIGVMVGSDINRDTTKLNSVTGVLGQILGLITQGNNETNIKDCNILIKPDISGFGMLSFSKSNIDKLVSLGYEAACENRKSLEDLKSFLSRWGEINTDLQAPKARYIGNESFELGDIKMVGVGKEDARWLLHKSRMDRERHKISGKDLDNRISVMFGTNAFSKINYAIVEDSLTHKYDATIYFKNRQPDGLNLGLRFDTQEAASIMLRFGFDTHRITSPQLAIDTKLGYNPYVTLNASYSHIYIPKINISYTVKKTESTINDIGKEYGNSRLIKHQAKIYLSEAYSRNIGVQFGLNFEQFLYSRLFTDSNSTPLDPHTGNPFLGLYGQFIYDNRNLPYHTSNGLKFDLSFNWRFHDFYRPKDFSQFGDVMVKFEHNHPITDRLVFTPQIYSRFLIGTGYDTKDSYNITYINYMGGMVCGRYVDHQLPFVGANRPEKMYDNLVIGMAELRYNISGNHFLSLMGSFARESMTFADMFLKASDNSDTVHNWWGAGLQYSFNLPVGPLKANVAYSNITRKVGFYLSFGYDF